MLHFPAPAGDAVTVEVGYINSYNLGIEVWRNGGVVHRSHPKKRVQYPRYLAATVERMGDAQNVDIGAYRRNAVPLLVDIAFAAIFHGVGLYFGLTAAAVTIAGLGVVAWVAQTLLRVDLLGGLALFGVAMSVVAATLAVVFRAEAAVKWTPSAINLIVGTLFLIDGLRGGVWLGRGLARYLPYRRLDLGRLATGIGALAITLAALNAAVAQFASTAVWLFYTSFVDAPLL